MGKIRSAKRFSDHFGINHNELIKIGALDVTLRSDTQLFIDPLLLSSSAQPEIRNGATKRYEKHFEEVIKLLARSTSQKDVAWRAAERRLSFPEVKWTCLGYGGDSVSGSGSGVFTRGAVMETARQIVAMGVDDPDLFVSLALLEDGIGPDRISDMVS